MEDPSLRARLAAKKLQIVMELAKRQGIKSLNSPEFDSLDKRADELLEIWKLSDALGDPDTEGGLFNGLARQYHAIQKEIEATETT